MSAADTDIDVTQTRVVLIGDGVWHGTFWEFVMANKDALSLEDISHAAEAIAAGNSWKFGGGASPSFTLSQEAHLFSYSVRVTPADGAGQCVIESSTCHRLGETPEQCLQREAADAGWDIIEIISIQRP